MFHILYCMCQVHGLTSGNVLFLVLYCMGQICGTVCGQWSHCPRSTTNVGLTHTHPQGRSTYTECHVLHGQGGCHQICIAVVSRGSMCHIWNKDHTL